MAQIERIPRPVLYAMATLFAAATLLYVGVWIYDTFWEPQARLGIDYGEPQSGQIVLGHIVLTNVEPGSGAERAGLKVGDRVVAINGRPVSSTEPFLPLILAKPGDKLDITIERGGQPSTVQAILGKASSQFQSLPLAERIAVSLIRTYPAWFLIGLVVLFLRIDDKNAWLLALVFAGFISGPNSAIQFRELDPALRIFAVSYRTIFFVLMPAAFFFFFARFPTRSQLDERAPWLKWTLLAGAPVVLGLALVPKPHPLAWVEPVYLFGGFGLGLVRLVMRWGGTIDSEARRKFRVIFWGTIIGTTPILLREAAVTFLAWRWPFWVDAVAVFMIALFPASFVYAVMKHRVMDIPVLFKRTLRYVVVRGAFTLLMTGVLAAATWRLAMVAEQSVLMQAGASVPVALMLGVLVGMVWLVSATHVEKLVKPRIDRRFFRSVYDTRQILQDLAEKTRTAANRAELAALLERHILEALHPESLAIYLSAGGGLLRLERFTPGPIPSTLETLTADVPVLQELARRGRPWDLPPQGQVVPPDLPQLGKLRALLEGVAPGPNRADVLSQLAPLQPECLVPLVGRDTRLDGLLVLGQRRSEEPYSGEDKELLYAVAGQASVALENIAMAETMAAKLEAEHKQKNEMSIAREVQAKLFPQRKPPLATLDYAGSCDQARIIGGDYYDFLDLGKGRAGLVLADISGKGIFAALLMANLQANLRSQYAQALEDLGGLMRSVNRLFVESVSSGLYATLFIADYSDEGRRLRYVNCGHNPPLLLRAAGGHERLESTATVVGLMEEWDCTVGETTLAPGDTLVVYSDGVTEASSDEDVFFGENRLLETMRAHAALPAEELMRTINRTVHTFSGKEQEDDLTLLVARAR